MDNQQLPNNIGIIVQCRDNSTRMKYKAVRLFHNGKSILQIILERFRYKTEKLVVATTENSPQTVGICNLLGIPYFIGDEKNVAERLYNTAKHYKMYGFYRICADNPFVSPVVMKFLSRQGHHYDYVAFENCMQRHEGFWMEYIKTEILYKSMMGCIGMYDLEHVTPFIIRNPWLFNQNIIKIPHLLNIGIRLTVDTESDFKIAQQIYKDVGIDIWSIVLYLKKNPKILKKMKKNIEENKK